MNIYLGLDTGNKAKEDIDVLMKKQGFRNVAVGSEWHGKIGRFFAKLLSVASLAMKAKRDDVLLVQYPFKKYYPTLCQLMHLRGGKVITLIHDLGCFRRKKLSVSQEMKKLQHTDVLIVHNEAMMDFLKQNGLKTPMLTLGIFDYLADTDPKGKPLHKKGETWDVVYAGGLAERKNRFLYTIDKEMEDDCCWKLHIHGRGLDDKKAALWKHVIPKGFIGSDEFIDTSVGHFGLVWDGESTNECAGNWGEYLKVNNPHKTSFYLRSGKPVIIWREAALAPFVEREGVGLTVGSLSEIDTRLRELSEEDYQQMVERCDEMRQRLATGYYFKKAHSAAIKSL